MAIKYYAVCKSNKFKNLIDQKNSRKIFSLKFFIFFGSEILGNLNEEKK